MANSRVDETELVAEQKSEDKVKKFLEASANNHALLFQQEIKKKIMKDKEDGLQAQIQLTDRYVSEIDDAINKLININMNYEKLVTLISDRFGYMCAKFQALELQYNALKASLPQSKATQKTSMNKEKSSDNFQMVIAVCEAYRIFTHAEVLRNESQKNLVVNQVIGFKDKIVVDINLLYGKKRLQIASEALQEPEKKSVCCVIS